MPNDVTRQVSEMYQRFPYPSPERRGLRLRELRNLLTLFSRETGWDLEGKRVLDVGTGTGHRLVEAARGFPGTRFVAVDVSEEPLAIARAVAEDEGVTNVELRVADLLAPDVDLGIFDVALAMGVLHHLPDPRLGLHTLVDRLADEGVAFLYVYGRHGSQERMRRKAIVSLLLDDSDEPFDDGLALVKALGFDTFDYGWTLDADDDAARDVLIVDAYLNVHEALFDIDGIRELADGSGLAAIAVFGVSVGQDGLLFDTRLEPDAPGRLLRRTSPADVLPAGPAQEAYARLPLDQKHRVLDLLYQPNGYTAIGLMPGALERLPETSRLRVNALPLG